MIERKSGHVVTISSLQGIYAFPFSLVYCASKFGCFGFMAALKEFLRIEKLDKFINTTTILPNMMRTRRDLIEIINPK
jgi:NADP-dependent 3-hydroxy acid dehydrogenase YdfG